MAIKNEKNHFVAHKKKKERRVDFYFPSKNGALPKYLVNFVAYILF